MTAYPLGMSVAGPGDSNRRSNRRSQPGHRCGGRRQRRGSSRPAAHPSQQTYDDLCAMLLWTRSEPEDLTQARVHCTHQHRGHVPDRARQIILVQGDQRRHVHNRIPRKSCRGGGHEDISRCRSQPSVGCEDGDEHCREPTAVVRIRLDDKYRAAFGRSRADGVTKIGPVNAPPFNHHSSSICAKRWRPAVTAASADSSSSIIASTASISLVSDCACRWFR